MGCDGSKPASADDSGTSNQNGDEFSENQIDTIRSTWPLLARDTKQHGIRVFLLIFLEEPKIKLAFKRFSDMADSELRENKLFQEHVTKFMQLIGVMVENIDVQKDEVDKMLLMLGAKHATFDGFSCEHFRVYAKCMMEVWESVIGEEFIQEVKDSWGAVFSYLTRLMTKGYSLYYQEQQLNSTDDHDVSEIT